jgi:hypothetical protein
MSFLIEKTFNLLAEHWKSMNTDLHYSIDALTMMSKMPWQKQDYP